MSYDLKGDQKPGGCCRANIWGWKAIDRTDLGTSALGWTKAGRPWTLLTIRVIILLWAIAIMIYSIILRSQKATSMTEISANPWWTWGIYFSSWSYISLILYFAFASYWSYTEISGASVARPTSKLERYLIINYEIAWGCNWAATLVFWFVVARECTFNMNCTGVLTVDNFHLHGVNVIWLLFESIFNMITIKPLHVIFVVIFVVVWIVFAQLWHLSGQWIYPQMDPAFPEVSMVAAFYCILIGASIICLLCGWGCHFLMERLYKNSRRSDDSDFLDGTPKVSTLCC